MTADLREALELFRAPKGTAARELIAIGTRRSTSAPIGSGCYFPQSECLTVNANWDNLNLRRHHRRGTA